MITGRNFNTGEFYIWGSIVDIIYIYQVWSSLIFKKKWRKRKNVLKVRRNNKSTNGHSLVIDTLTHTSERLLVGCSLPVCTTQVCRDRGLNTNLHHALRNLYQQSHGHICLGNAMTANEVCPWMFKWKCWLAILMLMPVILMMILMLLNL